MSVCPTLLAEVPETYLEKFAFIQVEDGYASYLKFCARKLDYMQQDEHELYERCNKR